MSHRQGLHSDDSPYPGEPLCYCDEKTPTTSTPTDLDKLREKLAAIEHERWADWQKWCHKVLRENNPSPEQGDILERWDRQIETPYSELSEREKDSDREQVDRYLPLIQAEIVKARINELEKVEIYDDSDMTQEYLLKRITALKEGLKK